MLIVARATCPRAVWDYLCTLPLGARAAYSRRWGGPPWPPTCAHGRNGLAWTLMDTDEQERR